jgi:hypothetical protein
MFALLLVGFASLLVFISAYHVCLLFALAFAWLYVADLHAIQFLAKAQNGFEIAYMAVQFFVVAVACLPLWDYLNGDEEITAG